MILQIHTFEDPTTSEQIWEEIEANQRKTTTNFLRPESQPVYLQLQTRAVNCTQTF